MLTRLHGYIMQNDDILQEYEEAETFECLCLPGYNGTLCEFNIDECQHNNCTEGSTCVDEENGFSCVCQQGQFGRIQNIPRQFKLQTSAKMPSRYHNKEFCIVTV